MTEQAADINYNHRLSEERCSMPDLAELDRILARHDEDDFSCKIATNSASFDGPKSQQPLGFEERDQAPMTVASLKPVTLPGLSNDPQVQTDTVSLPKTRSRKLQANVDKLLPSLKKPWRRQWPHERLARSFQVAEDARGIAFSLNVIFRGMRTLFKG